MVKVRFENEKKEIEIPVGTTILEAARRIGVQIEAPCGANGTCGACKVRVNNPERISSENVRHELSDEEKALGYVLACQAKIHGDLVVETYQKNNNETLKILSEGHSFEYKIFNNITKSFDGSHTDVYSGGKKIGREAGNTSDKAYGLAVDIGTTTLVVALIDLLSGREINSASALNPQSIHAQDVLTRIKLASNFNGLQLMYEAVNDEINRLILKTAMEVSIDTKHIYEVIYSGNTTMIHLACLEDPSSLGKYPYNFQIHGGESRPANKLSVSPFAEIYIPPIVSAYVGADITSGILAAQLHKRDGTVIFIDIGTNGEMVIARDGHLSATSTAAGPAFEGMNISCGMRAGSGAVEIVDLSPDGELVIKTIGNAHPVGICGSGLIDAVGILVSVGAIASNGRFVPPDGGSYPEAIAKHMKPREGKLCFELSDDVFLTQKDLRQVQLAKGAIRAGIESLMTAKSVQAEDIDEVQIAGSFGFHLRAKNLINIGLLPKEFEGKVNFLGNTSKTGAKAFLLNKSFREEFKELISSIEVIELANQSDFDKLFIRSLSF